MNTKELRSAHALKMTELKALTDKVMAEKRAMTEEEQRRYDQLMQEAEDLRATIERVERYEQEMARAERAAIRPDPQDEFIGLTQREVRRYSLVRALRAAAESAHDPRAWERIAPFERECSEAVAQRLGATPRGFFVPRDVIDTASSVRMFTRHGWVYVPEQRDLTKANSSALVATDLLADAFIDMLRNQMMVQRAGATILGDLVGDIAIPKQTGGATAYWVAEGNAPTESQMTVGQLQLAPRTVGAYTDISRKLLLQSSIDVEALVRRDLSLQLALAIDQAVLHGAGSSAGEPLGIASTPGVGVVYAGNAESNATNPNGAALTWADIVKLETLVATANADINATAYMTNAKVRGALKSTPKFASTDSRLIWEDYSDRPLNGYPVYVTNQVKSNLSKGTANNLSAIFFGNWADVVIAMWGTLDIIVDPYSGSTSGTLRVVALQDVNSAPRHAESFAVCLDVVA